MNILGIETATVVCSTALVRDGELLHAVSITEPYVHASKLMIQIDETLKSTRTTLPEIDAIAVSIGPGSFTGLRVGLSTAKGLGMALNKPLIPVSTLAGLARSAKESGEWRANELLLAMIHARKGEVYHCSYSRSIAGEIEAVSEEQVTTLNALMDALPAQATLVTGDVTQFRESTRMPDHVRFLSGRAGACNAGAIAIEGVTHFIHGRETDAVQLEPKYITGFFDKTRMATEH